jgi:mannobiose 2-epimerase
MSAERKEAVRERAAGLYAYLLEHFRDPKDGEFFFRVDATGKVNDTNKPLYGESFAIYALAEYAMAFGSEEAKKLALDCFDSIERRTYDAKYQGYDQSATSHWLSSGATKDTNTHLHLFESFTHLYRATGNAKVKTRALELLALIENKLVQPGNYTHAEFASDFTPYGRAYVSYGHDIETSWLIFDSLDAFGLSGDPTISERAWALGEHAAKWGMDTKQGGFYEEGPVEAAPNKLEKIWWIQAEAIAGLFRLYAYRPNPLNLEQLERTVTWVERYQRDPNEGEWYWGVLPDGTLGSHRDLKSEEWKSSYHLVRAMLFTSDWLKNYLDAHPAQ